MEDEDDEEDARYLFVFNRCFCFLFLPLYAAIINGYGKKHSLLFCVNR